MTTQFSEHAQSLLTQFYLLPYEQSIDEAFARASKAYSSDEDHANRILSYVQKGWFMFSSPILSNARLKDEEKKKAGLPISCYLTYVSDDLDGLISHTTENRWLSVLGGGVGASWSGVRAVSQKAPGPIPFIKTIDSDVEAYRQGKTRRASYAAYLDVDHPDIIEFLNLRVPTGGDTNRKAFNLHNAICISNKFMEAVLADMPFDLIDPHTKEVRETIQARELWQRILEVRFRTGEPYLMFKDTANKALPQALKDKGLQIHSSNLCSEIFLPTAKDRSAVCCLSSLNLEYYDEWKDTTIVEDCIEFLDNVIEYFITHAPEQLKNAIHGARQERSLGLGTMGFHSYLQSKSVPFESVIAKSLNISIFRNIKIKAQAQTQKLAIDRGEYPDGIGTGCRNAHLLAIAPNSNSSIILDTSPSIEPWAANAFTHRTRAGSFLSKNKYLDRLLLSKGLSDTEYDDVWQSIILHEGSVQHLDILTDKEKAVYKTAFEIDQRWVITHAGDRQQYICQGQSVNLFFPSGSDKAYVNQCHLQAWHAGLKSLYYLRTTAGSFAEKISKPVITKVNSDECIACQG